MRKGYFSDPFLPFFVSGDPPLKPPLINRGYYTRVMAVRLVLAQFLEAGGSQVLTLGAGYDTTYFRLKVLPPAPCPHASHNLRVRGRTWPNTLRSTSLTWSKSSRL